MSPFVNAVRPIFVPLCLILATTACGGSGGQSGNAMAMKDLEVVDGTTSDAMTDLDGVRAEGTAMAPAPANAAHAAPAVPQTANGSDTAPQPASQPDAEVVSDQ